MNRKWHYRLIPKPSSLFGRRCYKTPIKICFILCLLPCSLWATPLTVIASSGLASLTGASSIQVKGSVTDAEGVAIVGAAIYVVDSKKGYMTDREGNFSFGVQIGSTLQISFLGYISQTIVADRENIKVVLQEDVQGLDEVVVVGYGTQLKKNLTGAIANISGTDVMTTKATNVTSSLAGKVAGVNIRQMSGQPGANDVQFNVRGFGTPLFIVDGVLRSSADAFSRLNPDDIEDISVLKDATASVYGIGAGNGVVIVTTKKGTNQRAKVSYSGLYGLTVPTGIPEMCNAAEWVELRNEAEINAGRNPMWSEEEFNKWQTGAPGYESTDWQDAVLNKTASQQQHMVSVKGGSDKSTYYVSFGYLNETGLFKNADDISYDQFNFRSNLSFDLRKNLKANINFGGSYDVRNSTAVPYASIISQAHSIPPIYKVYANDNPEYLNDVYPSNPVAYASSDRAGYSKYKGSGIQTTATLTYEAPFLKGLSGKVLFAYDYGTGRNTYVNKGYTVYSYSAAQDTYTPIPKNQPPNIGKSGSYNSLLNFQGSISYKNSFGNHNVDGTVVWEVMERKGEWYGLSREYDVYTNDTIDQANRLESKENSGSDNSSRNLSLITRVHYDFAGKYLFDFASRYDGSWRYAPHQRWGFFPNVSIGWRVSEEPFIKNNIGDIITNLKFRASYGQMGEDVGNPFQWIPGYVIGTGSGFIFNPGENTQGAAPPILVNDRMTWVKVHTYDIGVDLSLWNGLLGVEFDIYKRERKGQLSYRNTSVPWYFGQTLPQENLNSDRYMGLDLTISSHKKFNEVTLGVRAIMNYSRSKGLYREQNAYNTAYSNWWGNRAYRLTGRRSTYELVGRFQNMEEIYHAANHDPSYGGTKRMLPGDFIYRDTNSDGFITDADKRDRRFWNSTPKFHYGLNIDLSWKNFDINILFNGSMMYSLRYDGVYTTMLGTDGSGNAPKYMLNRWHRADPYDVNSEWIAGKWPAIRKTSDVTSIYNDSSFWIKKGDYLRLKSVEIGYTLPTRFLKKINIEHARVFINGYNLLTICNSFLKPFDPEKGDGGSTYGYPLSRLFNIGLNITF